MRLVICFGSNTGVDLRMRFSETRADASALKAARGFAKLFAASLSIIIIRDVSPNLYIDVIQMSIWFVCENEILS